MSNVCDCTRPCGDAFACHECARTARDNLRHIADLAAALDEKRAKVRSSWDMSNLDTSKPARKWRTDDNQALTHVAAPSFRPSTALSFDPRVSRVADRIHNGLVGIVRELPPSRPTPPTLGPTCRGCIHGSCRRIRHRNDFPEDRPAAIARWLSRRIRQMQLQPTASETFALIGRMVGDLHRLFDNPPPALFLGECKMISQDGEECHESIYLDADKVTSAEVACPKCGITHDVAERRKTLMQAVDDYLGTAKEISRLLRNIGGSDVSTKMIHSYAAHGMLTKMGTRLEPDREGRPRQATLYRIGQVREAVQSVQSKRQKRRSAVAVAEGTERRVC